MIGPIAQFAHQAAKTQQPSRLAARFRAGDTSGKVPTTRHRHLNVLKITILFLFASKDHQIWHTK